MSEVQTNGRGRPRKLPVLNDKAVQSPIDIYGDEPQMPAFDPVKYAESIAYKEEPFGDDPLEKIAAKALEEGKKQSALLKAGFTMEQINAKPQKVRWIYNERIGNISPMVGNFVPRGEEGYFVYEPVYEVTDENKAEHIELCKQRLNTKAISAKVTLPDFENDYSGLMKPAQPSTPQEVRLGTGAI